MQAIAQTFEAKHTRVNTIELSHEQDLAVERAKLGENLLISGAAGTGKGLFPANSIEHYVSIFYENIFVQLFTDFADNLAFFHHIPRRCYEYIDSLHA